jgi:hypothetical protein
MMERIPRGAAALGLALLLLIGCREADRPTGPGQGAGITLDSDPPGARIFIGGKDTGFRTPHTFLDLSAGVHDIRVQIDTMGLLYGYQTRINLPATDTVVDLTGPLLLRCADEACQRALARYRRGAGIEFATNPSGMLLFEAGSGSGLFWPAGSSNSYVAVGAPVFAGVPMGTGSPVALGPYSMGYVAGRPFPEATAAGGVTFRQATWILPPGQLLGIRTVRGLEIGQTVIAHDDVPDVLLIRLVFRNITNRPSYRAADPALLPGGLSYENAYIGFVLDADVGDHRDDLPSFVPDLNLAFMYDADFREPLFGVDANRPGLIGVRALAAPAGANVLLTAFSGERDWRSGEVGQPGSERNGWDWLAGTQTTDAVHPDPRLGHVPGTTPADYRVMVSAGPIRLPAGDSAVLTLAVVLASPAPGQFTAGSIVPPGDPLDPTRQIRIIAEPLVQRARAAEALLPRLQP